MLTFVKEHWLRLLPLAGAIAALSFSYFGVAFLLAGVAVTAFIFFFQRSHFVLQYTFFQRYSLISALLFFSLPILAIYGQPEVLGPLFEVSLLGIVTITFFSVLGAWTIMFTSGLMYLAVALRNTLPFNRLKKRGQPNDFPRWFKKARFFSYLLLALPTWVVLFIRSQHSVLETLGAIGLGIALAYGLKWISKVLGKLAHDIQNLIGNTEFWKSFLVIYEQIGSPRIAKLLTFFGKQAWVQRLGSSVSDFGKGLQSYQYQDRSKITTKSKPEFDFSPVRGIVFFLLTLTIYLTGYFVFKPPAVIENEPSFAYILLILMLWSWLLCFLSLFLDNYRIPVSMVVILFIFTLYQLNDVEHYYEVRASTSSLETPEPVEHLQSWLAKHPQESHPNIVLVAAAGGGIRAGYWTNVVLDNLNKNLGPEFAESIALMSTVSGGAVGSVFSVDAYPQGSADQCPDLDKDMFALPLKQSGTESIHAMAWGMAYPDTFRTLLPFLPANKLMDRGWALERKWNYTLGNQRTLDDWQADTNLGCRPAVVFNATVVESGDRFLLGTVNIPELEDEFSPTENRQAANFSEVFAGCDIDAFTAARLSATFPYLTPQATDKSSDKNCRPNGQESWGFHIADGGYYDNYGVVTALEYLITVLQSKLDLQGRKVLLVQIRASEVDKQGEPGRGKGFVFSTWGPFKALMSVRSSTQITRNDLDVGLVQRVFGNRVVSATFELGDVGPLSWDLTEAQKRAIEAQWNTDKNRDQMAVVQELF